MKLAIFFALMVISLIVSVGLGRRQIIKTQKFLIAFLYAFLSNIVILGLASLWWFLTEIDGISQALGVIYYSIAAGVIGIIDIIVIMTIKKTNSN